MQISNALARRLWLWTNGFGAAPAKLNLLEIIERLGFVQLDTIRNVSRAHHHILWSRHQDYREPMLWQALKSRELFEHFTHDAALIPMRFYPMWRRQFDRMGERTAGEGWHHSGLSKSDIAGILARIKAEGPLSTQAFDTKITGAKQMWARPPHKKALDQMWYAGVLTTSHRLNFTKYYDLAERVIPAEIRQINHNAAAQINWLCAGALDRLSIASPGDIQRFWAATTASEVKDWITSRTDLAEVEVVLADGSKARHLAPADIENRLAQLPEPSQRLRLLNPFDPLIRDRTRLERLFGFAYKNEMFVPKSKRRWGYYVYPLLQGTGFVGRLEAKADRAKGTLNITGFWPEPGCVWGKTRARALAAELARFARLIGAQDINWQVAPP